MRNHGQNLIPIGLLREPNDLFFLPWAFQFQGPKQNLGGLLRAGLVVSSLSLVVSEPRLPYQKRPCLPRLDLLKLPAQKLFQIPWLDVP